MWLLLFATTIKTLTCCSTIALDKHAYRWEVHFISGVYNHYRRAAHCGIFIILHSNWKFDPPTNQCWNSNWKWVQCTPPPVSCRGKLWALCRAHASRLPPPHRRSRGEISDTFLLLSEPEPICWGGNQRWQWHPSTLSQPINKQNDTFAHSQMAHARARTSACMLMRSRLNVSPPRARATCPIRDTTSQCSPWWTHLSGRRWWEKQECKGSRGADGEPVFLCVLFFFPFDLKMYPSQQRKYKVNLFTRHKMKKRKMSTDKRITTTTTKM